jgi:hypothetical protein
MRRTPVLAALFLLACGGEKPAPEETGGSPDAGGTATVAFSMCIEITAAPKTCNEICQARGATCDGRCHPQGSLRQESAYYVDSASCEADEPLLYGLSGCTDDGSTAKRLFGATFMRCCCV